MIPICPAEKKRSFELGIKNKIVIHLEVKGQEENKFNMEIM
jgi:hypothetical protein